MFLCCSPVSKNRRQPGVFYASRPAAGQLEIRNNEAVARLTKLVIDLGEIIECKKLLAECRGVPAGTSREDELADQFTAEIARIIDSAPSAGSAVAASNTTK